MSHAAKQRRHTAASRAKMSLAQKERTPAQRAHTAALAILRTGMAHTAEARAKVSASRRAAPLRTHCAKGHPFSEENTGPNRRCRTCGRDQRRRQRGVPPME